MGQRTLIFAGITGLTLATVTALLATQGSALFAGMVGFLGLTIAFVAVACMEGEDKDFVTLWGRGLAFVGGVYLFGGSLHFLDGMTLIFATILFMAIVVFATAAMAGSIFRNRGISRI